nr:integrase, catalytic region, zinc finger, CCHC-type, peptidase aspartic, catalytic [Tanacetum cinerariifolium]
MANLSKDIQCAGSDTRPLMLDRTDFASWQQRIRLYCRGKENGVNILKSIDEGPFQMGTLRETLTEGTEGALHLGPERPRVYYDLTSEEKDRVVIQNVQGRRNRGKGNNAQGTVAASYEGAQNRVGYANPEYFKDKMLLMQAQENGVALDEKQLLFIASGQDNAIDEEAPMAQTMFMANLSSADRVYDEAGSSYDSDILSESTLEIAKITKKKINEKMKTPLWTHNKINIRPLDYSKEIFLATFTPQTQLTPEQIFWSKDVLKMKIKALKEQAKAAKPVKALTVYPSNTPVKLVPMELLTKSQVKINIFALIQLFLKFEKTCKMRITPTGHTEGERGFEQTKECYLTEVISFFKTLKEHFEGIQKALTIEIKEMQVIFDELEAEVDQNALNRMCDEIERKSIIIANDTLIANCLSKEVFYIATNSELNVSRFLEMHDAHTVVQACCLELETGLSKLKDKIQKDDHDVMEALCYVRDTNDVELIKGSRGSNVYTISVEDMMKSSPICMLPKASKTKSWL